MTAIDIYNNNKSIYDQLIISFQTQNSIINLSSFNDTESILQKHILDSLHIFEFNEFENLLIKKDGNTYLLKIADIGTGGGFPGLAVAIALPHISFYLIESITKKCKAVLVMLEELGLKNVVVINKRAEDINKNDFINISSDTSNISYSSYSSLKLDFADITISRAVTQFDKIMEWSKYITKANGSIYLYKGLKEEITGFKEKKEYNILNDTRVIYRF